MNTKLLSLVLVTSLGAVGACSSSGSDKSKPGDIEKDCKERAENLPKPCR